jgi:hypothetical protein
VHPHVPTPHESFDARRVDRCTRIPCVRVLRHHRGRTTPMLSCPCIGWSDRASACSDTARVERRRPCRPVHTHPLRRHAPTSHKSFDARRVGTCTHISCVRMVRHRRGRTTAMLSFRAVRAEPDQPRITRATRSRSYDTDDVVPSRARPGPAGRASPVRHGRRRTTPAMSFRVGRARAPAPADHPRDTVEVVRHRRCRSESGESGAPERPALTTRAGASAATAPGARAAPPVRAACAPHPAARSAARPSAARRRRGGPRA